ncbi:MAG TPA: isoprenylcysteine carboxylmethyltransferase family protein [Thermoanaerobaculia bacterium]|nr:isoprenylcysteine carboxylmethyltransferase family protein [Thermoanaerobaculia bacterium]
MKVVKPPILFFACLIVGGLLHLSWPFEIAPYSFEAGLIAGGACVCAAAALGALTIREMKRHETSLEPGQVPARLVTSGPFRFTRNPLYLAQLLFLAGIALAVNSAWFLVAAMVQLVLLDRLIVVREEAVIRQKFGTEYVSYVARVRRWI